MANETTKQTTKKVRYVTTIDREVSNVTSVAKQEWDETLQDWQTTDAVELDRDLDDAETVSITDTTEEELATARKLEIGF